MESQLFLAWPELRITRAANGIQALQCIDELAPDVVFLDIQMPGLNGIDLAARLCQSSNPPHVVFATAYDCYTLKAFENAAFDYLLKPIGLERLARTVARLKAALARPVAAPTLDAMAALLHQLSVATSASSPLQWIRAASGQETRLVAINEVIYFQSNDKYTSVVLADGECLIRTPLSKLKEQLDAQQFWQIHRSVIVSVKHVAGTRTDFRGRLQVLLKGRAEPLIVSRNYVDQFKQM
jgi:DNA-binding LytR/AlgR family response regulator